MYVKVEDNRKKGDDVSAEVWDTESHQCLTIIGSDENFIRGLFESLVKNQELVLMLGDQDCTIEFEVFIHFTMDRDLPTRPRLEISDREYVVELDLALAFAETYDTFLDQVLKTLLKDPYVSEFPELKKAIEEISLCE